MIFQEPMSSLNPVFTVGFQIGEVLRLHLGMSAQQARSRTIALLDEVGIPDPARKIDAYPSQMSGGQQQRVMIAMAIACEPKLLIADEPTTALDVTIQKQIIELLARPAKDAATWRCCSSPTTWRWWERSPTMSIVMRHGEVREAGAGRADVPAAGRPLHAARCCIAGRNLNERPLRLPVIDDYVAGALPAANLSSASAAAAADDVPVLVVDGLSKSFYVREGLFGKREFKAVDNVSFTLAAGKTLGVVGESGSGKTTVGLTLLRLHQATGGSALFEGRDLLSMSKAEYLPYKRRIQIIFQNPYASLNPRFTVGQILLEPMRIHRIGADDSERQALAAALLQRVGLPAQAHAPLSARVFRRPAPANRHRALPDHEAGNTGVRRIGVGARRLGAGPGIESAAGSAGRVRPVATFLSRTTCRWSNTSPTR